MAWKVHSFMQYANDHDPVLICFEEDAVPSAGRNAKSTAQIVARTATRIAGGEFLHGVAKFRKVPARLFGAPISLRIARIDLRSAWAISVS